MAAFAPLQTGDPGRVGRYRIVGRLGRGGMGQVYLGLSPSGRAVAVKVVRAALADDPGFRRRFAREVAAAREVTGFFTAAVVDADPEGTPAWLATTYIPGMSLEAAVAAHGAWPKRSVLALGAALAEALGAVHCSKLVHRDLKPSNVLLAADGPRVIDFGISLAAETTKLTEAGVVIGTPGFISPEQLVADKVSAASDVFALGAVLAYAATGSGPFGTGAAQALNYRVAHAEPDLTGLPPGLADVVARCLAKDPDQRPTVPHLVEELGRASANGGADGFFTEADWLPEPVAAEIARAQATPLPRPVEQSTAEPAPTAVATAPLPEEAGGVATAPPIEEAGAVATAPPPASSAVQPPPSDSTDSTPGGGKRGLTRRRILTGLVVAAVLSLVYTTALLSGLLPGGDGQGDDASSGAPARKEPVRKELWSYALDDQMELSTVADGRVYLDNGKDSLYALDADSGDELWHQRGTGGSLLLLGASGGMAYYGDDDYMYALDADSGDEIWKFKDGGVHLVPVTVGETTYATYSGFLAAVRSDTGKGIWRKKYDGALREGVTIADGVLYPVSAAGDGTLYAVDAKSGDDLWEFKAGSEIVSSPVVADGTVYFGSKDGTLYAVDSDSGREVWRRGFDGTLWDPAIADGAGDPIVADGVVYFENDGYVCAFTADNGKPLWRHKPRLEDVELLSVVGDTVLFSDGGDGSDGGRTLYSLDARSGDRVRKEDLGENQTVVDGTLYYENAGRLHAVSATATDE
ncbi:PQQ-binding-like beta-propeller repeat protein [Streptomyces milbemycinicus]|uniref:outer membrane protein assembly factor BamB family protein n=1 Tax=Streptomyces milbemycinicus TaxID=476552 RepID=UPI0033C788BD